MSAIIKQLTDKEDANDLLPITNIKAVYDDNGNRLDNILKQSGGNLISDAYNPSRNYSAGEFCIYNNTLWKSKVNNNTGNTPSEGSYWTATNVGTVVSGISNDLSELLKIEYATLMIPSGVVDSDFSVPTYEGYKLKGVLGYGVFTAALTIFGCRVKPDSQQIYVYGNNGMSIEVGMMVNLLYVKDI